MDYKNLENDKLIKNLTEKIIERLSRYVEIDSIILFGSYAKRTHTQESDIDLCIFLKNKVPIFLEDKIFEQLLDIEKELDKDIQCVFISPENLEKWDQNFLENILAEGQLLYGSTRHKKF